MENASTRHTWDELKALIAEKREMGWEFVFMGAGIDAYAQGARMGIDRSATLSYGTERRQTEAAFDALGENTAAFACYESRSVSYSVDQKVSAGDID